MSHHDEKPAHGNKEQPLLAAPRDKPAAVKMQHSQKLTKGRIKSSITRKTVFSIVYTLKLRLF